MARIICAKSGITFHCEFIPIALATKEFTHPIFHVTQHKLIALAGNWAAGKLNPTESYLLFLALLDSTDLMVWRTHAQYIAPKLDPIVAANMPELLSIISKINVIQHPAFTLPHFAITQDTCTLENAYHWIKVWNENYEDWYDGQVESRIRDKLRDRESALQRLIKSSTPVSAYAKRLADWASVAGSFPTFDIDHPISHQPIPISDYWKQIITTLANEDKISHYPQKDIEELIEHCECNIMHGNIYSFTLMKYLRDGLARYKDYLGFGGMEGLATSFTIMPPNASVYQINRAAALNSAPDSEPKKHQYPNLGAWLKAYTKWKLKLHITNQAANATNKS